MKQNNYRISTVMVPKDSFTEEESIDPIAEHFKFKKVTQNKHFYLFRQNSPSYLKSKGFYGFSKQNLTK